jgi:hypothetical protein
VVGGVLARRGVGWGDGAGTKPVLQLANGGLRNCLPNPEAAGAPRAGAVRQRRGRGDLERAQRFLEREHIERIVGAYRAYQDVAGFARGAALDEIWAHGANLNIPLYMPPAGNGNGDGATDKPLSRVIAECEQSSRRLWQSMEQLWETLSAVG